MFQGGLSGLEKLHKRVGDLGAVIVRDPRGCSFYVPHQAIEIVARGRDADYADRRAVPEFRGIELGDRNVEAGTKTVFQAANHLATIFDGLRGFDVEFEGEESDHTGFRGQGSEVRRKKRSSDPWRLAPVLCDYFRRDPF